MSKKLTEKQIDKIIYLLNKKKWDRVEKLLLSYKDYNDSKIDYFWGCFYKYWDNPALNKEKAKKYFRRVIVSKEPIYDAFDKLSDLENESQAIRIIRKGLKIFPENEYFYYKLINLTKPLKRYNIYIEAKENGIISERIQIIMAETFFNQKDYKKTLDFLEVVKGENIEESNTINIIRAFSYYELGLLKDSKKIFSNIIEEDFNYKLGYIPHIGLILNFLKENENEEHECIIEEINPEYQLDHPLIWGYARLDASDYITKVLNQLVKICKKTKIKAIVRGLRGLFLYSKAFEEGENKILQKKVIRDLEFANKYFTQNTEFCKHLYCIYIENQRDPRKAWNYYKKYALKCDEDIYLDIDLTENIDTDIFEDILCDFEHLIEESYYLKKIAKTFLQPIIDRLYKEKKYKKIIDLAKRFSDNDLECSPLLFQIAYSYSDEKDFLTSKKYYEKHIKEVGKSAAALNNLGVIYEKMNELSKAKEMYLEALDLEKNEEVYKNNLKSINKLIKDKEKEEIELKETLEKFKLESPYVKAKVLEFYSHRNAEGLIICSYRQAPQYLKMFEINAVEFLRDLLTKKYFLKVQEHEYDTSSNVYSLNPYYS